MDGFSDAEIRAHFQLDSTDAQAHARCGRKAKCRVDALAKVDQDLDVWLVGHPVVHASPGCLAPVPA